MSTKTDLINIGSLLISIEESATQYKMATADQIMSRIDNDGWTGIRAALEPSEEVATMMQEGYFGMHIGLDVFGGNSKHINDLNCVARFLDELPENIGMQKITQPHVFLYNDPNPLRSGISGDVFLSTSMAGFHSFPAKDGFYSVDVYSCKVFNPWQVWSESIRCFGGESSQINVNFRGRGFKN